MNRSDYYLFFVIGFLGGIIICEFWRDQDIFKCLIFLVMGFVLLWKCMKNQKKKIFVYGMIILSIFLGYLRFNFAFEKGANHIKNFVGKIEFEGCVSEEVDVRNDKVKYVVEAERIKLDEKWQDVWGRILINGDRYPVYEYGDCFYVKGKLQLPEKIDDFNYDKYLARYSIYSIMYRAKIQRFSEGGPGFFRWIFKFKSEFEKKLSEIFAEPYSSFMAGLILGSRKGIPDHLMQDFNTTGLTHIIAMTGFNLTLIIVVVGSLLAFLSRKMKIVFSVIFIIIFTILVGASAAVVRAAIMGVLSLIALWYGRKYFVIIGLFTAAFLMNLWNPKILVYDVGFQLSFLATAGIILFSGSIERIFKFVPEVFGVKEAILMTFSAQILALPIILLNFGRLSLISPIANVFVLPLIPLAMIFGFFAVLSDMFSVFLSEVFGFFGYVVLNVAIFFVKIFANVKFASINLDWIKWWMVLVYYYLMVNQFRK